MVRVAGVVAAEAAAVVDAVVAELVTAAAGVAGAGVAITPNAFSMSRAIYPDRSALLFSRLDRAGRDT